MSDQAANLAREAMGIHQSLKELLQTKAPFDKDVDFQRKNLRRRYLNMLLIYPYAKESQDVENHLWMQTSYSFISAYKQRINALDRAIQNQQRQQHQQGQNGHGPGPVEYRKLVQRFKQFLAEEEKFWTQLVLRLHRSFDLHEAQPTLVSLGLLSGTDETVNSMDGAQSSRNHFQFPPEDPAAPVAPTHTADRASRLAILTKALICLGDIARYRELYNEANNRPRAGYEDLGPARRGRRRGGVPGTEILPRPRNYEKAKNCYEKARSLLPYDGNPYHQLAIIASYHKDTFLSIIYYYRALCVRQPYDTASENMNTMLSKALESWRRTRKEKDRPVPQDAQLLPPRIRIDQFKEKVVVLHALWRVGMEKGIEKMDSIARKHDRSVFEDFYALVSERHMPVEMISNAVMLSQGALWKHRMLRDTSTSTHSPRQAATPPPGTSTIVEWRILDHIFDLHRALLEVGKEELKDPPPMEANDLAQRITAIFRRTLPALRIASKWLRANYKYVMQDQEFIAFQEKEKTRGVEINKGSTQKLSGFSTHTIRFWKAFAEFIRLLGRAFPAKNLPPLTSPLEEDVEMRGFLPLKNLMSVSKDPNSVEDASGTIPTREQVHPNVEQLMRISDMLEDARVLAGMENSPVPLVAGTMMFNPDIVEQIRPPTHPEVRPRLPLDVAAEIPPNPESSYSVVPGPHTTPLDDDSMTETTSVTDEDVVNSAFRHLNVEIATEDEQEEEIVYPRGPVSPPMSPPARTSPKIPIKPIINPTGPSPRSSMHQHATNFSGTPAVPPAHSTTAQDLLNKVMNAGRNRSLSNSLVAHAESSAPQPPFLLTNHSIWSTSHDEQSLRFNPAASGSASPSYHAHTLQPQKIPQQSIWSSPSYPSVPHSSSSQQNVIGTLPNTHGVHSSGRGGHQRIPSAPLVAAQLFPSHNIQHDPFGYSSPMGQQPIRAPEPQQVSSPFINPPMQPGNGQQYYNNYSPMNSYHDRHVSSHSSHAGGQGFQSPHMSMSQVWGNVG